MPRITYDYPRRTEKEVYPVPEYWTAEEKMGQKPPTHWEEREPSYRPSMPMGEIIREEERKREERGREGESWWERMKRYETPTPTGEAWQIYERTGGEMLPEFDIRLEGDVQEFISRYAESEVRIPGGFEEWPDEQKAMWAEQNKPYGGAIFNTITGEQMLWEEARELARTNPDLPVMVVYPLGGGQAAKVTQPLRELALSAEEWEEMERQRMSTAINALSEREAEAMRRAMEREREVAERFADRMRAALEAGASTEELKRIKDEVESEFYRLFQEDEDYAAFLGRPEFHMQEGGPGILRERMGMALTKAMSGFPVEFRLRYQEAVGGKEARPGVEDRLREYGLWVSGTYPYITPLSRAQIGRLPPEIIALIKSYLSERGLSWEDYLAISEPAAREVPEEWGERVPTRWGVPSQF